MRLARFGPRTLAGRLRLALWLAAAVGIAVASAVFYLYWSHNVLLLRTSELKRQVSVIAAGMAVGDVVPGSARDTDLTRARLLTVEAGMIAARIGIANADGTVLFSSAGSAALPVYPIARLTPGPTVYDPRTGVIAIPGVGRVLVVAVPVAFGDDGQPSRYLFGARALSEQRAADTWVAVAMAAAALVALVVAWLIGALLARRIVEPLSKLTRGAEDIAAGRWGRQVPVEGDDETAQLARAFNDMSARTAAAYRAQEAFVSDVSHELRTPVTSISGFAAAIADGTVSDAAGVKRAAGIIAAEAGRLTELTSALLALSDLEAGTVAVVSEPVDTDEIAGALRDRFGFVAHERGIALEVDLDGAGPRADAARVLQALSALVDNALGHAEGRVTVEAGTEGARWIARVDDDGPGIPEEERSRVFDRFARLDTSRSGGGSGLGLAICRRIIELMGGSVHVERSPRLGGARFVVDLPAAGSDRPVLNVNSTRSQ